MNCSVFHLDHICYGTFDQFYHIDYQSSLPYRNKPTFSEDKNFITVVALCPLPVFQVVVMLLYLSVLLGLYVVPLYITSPCIMDPSTLRPRPDVIGQRGAPMVSHCMELTRYENAN